MRHSFLSLGHILSFGCSAGSNAVTCALATLQFSFQCRLTIFKQHFNDLAKIALQFIKRLCLRVSAREARHIA